MNIRKILQASACSLIALNLVDKSVLHILLIMVDYVKSAIQNKQQITSTQSTFKEYHGNPKKINFQLYYRKFSQQRNSILSYYYRRVTRWRRGRSLSCTFLKIGRKWPVLRKSLLNLVIFGLNVSFKMQFVSLLSRKNPKFFPVWPFDLQFLMKCFSECHNSKKAPLPKFPVMHLYYNDLLRIALRKNRF